MRLGGTEEPQVHMGNVHRIEIVACRCERRTFRWWLSRLLSANDNF